MKRAWPVVVACLLLYLAAAVQMADPTRVSLSTARPDLIAVVGLSWALVVAPVWGTVIGFVMGMLAAASPGMHAFALTFAGVVVGTLAPLSRNYGLEIPIPVGMLLVAVGTLLMRLIAMFLAGPPDLADYIGATILTAVYNGVLAGPAYGLLRLLFRPTAV